MAFKIRELTLDVKKTIKGKFEPSRTAEQDFYRAIKKVAKASGAIVESHVTGAKLADEKTMQKILKSYSEALGPWATRQSAQLLKRIQAANAKAYKQKAKLLGIAYEEGFARSEVGATATRLLLEQVELIKSIPIESGIRAQEIAFNASIEGTRAVPDQSIIDELVKQMGMTTEVATNRAKLIARTETARATASINQARAMAAKSSQYRWHNSDDGAVRKSHKTWHGQRLQGKIFSWDNPPTLDDGMTGHPGTFPNCRCFAEPIFDEE